MVSARAQSEVLPAANTVLWAAGNIKWRSQWNQQLPSLVSPLVSWWGVSCEAFSNYTYQVLATDAGAGCEMYIKWPDRDVQVKVPTIPSGLSLITTRAAFSSKLKASTSFLQEWDSKREMGEGFRDLVQVLSLVYGGATLGSVLVKVKVYSCDGAGEPEDVKLELPSTSNTNTLATKTGELLDAVRSFHGVFFRCEDVASAYRARMKQQTKDYQARVL